MEIVRSAPFQCSIGKGHDTSCLYMHHAMLILGCPSDESWELYGAALRLASPDRFGCGHQIGSYLGLIPCEDSSADRQRLGHITKQGSSRLRFLLVEAAQAAVRWDPERRSRVHGIRTPTFFVKAGLNLPGRGLRCGGD